MQLYHHPYSLDSQKVRIALEEKAIDYTSFHVNPLTGRNMDASFFRINPSARLPVFQNGGHRIFEPIEIILYVERMAALSSSSGGEYSTKVSDNLLSWMQKIQDWEPTIFTLSRVPNKFRLFVCKFLRRVIIARMAEAPDMASSYHIKLREAYQSEDLLKDPKQAAMSEEQLLNLLDCVEDKLKESRYLSGDEFGLVDYVFVPILARIKLLNLEGVYIDSRPNVAHYWSVVQLRPSYKAVIGKYFTGWRKYKTLMRTFCFVGLRTLFRRH